MSKIKSNGKIITVPVFKKRWTSPLPTTRSDASVIMLNALKALIDVTMSTDDWETYYRLRTALIAMGMEVCETVERGYKHELKEFKEFAVTISAPPFVVVYKKAATEEEARKLVESELAAGQTILKVEEFK